MGEIEIGDNLRDLLKNICYLGGFGGLVGYGLYCWREYALKKVERLAEIAAANQRILEAKAKANSECLKAASDYLQSSGYSSLVEKRISLLKELLQTNAGVLSDRKQTRNLRKILESVFKGEDTSKIKELTLRIAGSPKV